MFADETLTGSVGKYGPVDGTGRAAMALAARSRRHSQDGALAANRGELRNRGFYACGRENPDRYSGENVKAFSKS